MSEPAQRRKILLFVVLSFFCLGLPRVLTNTAAFTLFLQTFESRWLPLTYIGAAVASPAIGWMFIQLQRRLSFWALLQAALLTDLCVILALRAGLAQFDGEVGRALVMATAIWVEVEWMLAGLVFWGLAERMFTIREAKSLFGRIVAGEPAAVIAGGFAIPLFVALIGTADLLTVSAVSMAASLLLLLVVRRRYGADLHEEEEEDEDTPVSFGRYRRYVYLAFALAVMAETAHFFVDNAFYDRAETAFPDEGALASFIGFFFALSGAVTLVANVAVTGPVMRRFGLRTGLLLLPALLTLASAAVVGAAAAGLLGRHLRAGLHCQADRRGGAQRRLQRRVPGRLPAFASHVAHPGAGDQRELFRTGCRGPWRPAAAGPDHVFCLRRSRHPGRADRHPGGVDGVVPPAHARLSRRADTSPVARARAG